MVALAIMPEEKNYLIINVTVNVNIKIFSLLSSFFKETVKKMNARLNEASRFTHLSWQKWDQHRKLRKKESPVRLSHAYGRISIFRCDLSWVILRTSLTSHTAMWPDREMGKWLTFDTYHRNLPEKDVRSDIYLLDMWRYVSFLTYISGIWGRYMSKMT